MASSEGLGQSSTTERKAAPTALSEQRDCPGNWRYWLALLAALLALWIVFGAMVGWCMFKADGHIVYCLDDAYISMAMARNLAEHGTWGVSANGFSSTASSPLWIFLLAAIFAVTGVHQSIPLLLNVLFASALLTTIWAILRSFRVWPLACYLLLLLVVFWVPVVPVAFTGLEHMLQACVALWFAYALARSLADDVPPQSQARAVKVLLFLAPLVTLVRYEGMFLLGAAAVLLVLRKRFCIAALVLGLGLLPVVVAGVIFLGKGWYFLPASILMKGYAPPLRDWGAVVGFLRNSVFRCAESGHLTILIGAVLAIMLLFGRAILRLRSGIMASVFLITTLMHVEFAGVGWFYRYEAYLVCLGLVVLVALLSEISFRRQWSWQSLVPQFGPAWAKFAVMAIPLLFIAHPLIQRACRAHCDATKAPVNNYQQQYQMGLFLREYYNGAAVAANDIGAINYLANIRCLDLMGLGDLDVARLRRSGQFGTEEIQKLAQQRGVTIAIVYAEWFKQHRAIPSDWIEVGKWTISNNVVCADATVTFYAVGPAEASRLRNNLDNFQRRLPAGIVTSMTPMPNTETTSALPRKQENAKP